MTKEETIMIMALLSGLYGNGKGNPEIMADAWFNILEPYDYHHARNAVLNYAKNDVREYASLPTVGNIVKCIEEEMAKEEAPIKEIIRAVSYGWGYDQLSEKAKQNIGEDRYNEWLKIDAEEFAGKTNIYAETLRRKRKRLTE